MIQRTGRHARPVRPDSQSQAQCWTRDLPPRCGATFCPRHRADDYASHMGRHATDSIR